MTDKLLIERELLPCPFCSGTKIKSNNDEGRFWNTCQTCCADGPLTGKRSPDDATDWNTRALLAQSACETCSGSGHFPLDSKCPDCAQPAEQPYQEVDPTDLDQCERFLMGRGPHAAAFFPKDANTLANITMHCIRELRARRAEQPSAAKDMYGVCMLVAEAAIKFGRGRDRAVRADECREVVDSVLAAPQPAAEQCEHDWVDARNSHVTSGEICAKCHALRAGNQSAAERCEVCDGTGDVHSHTGEWLGKCPFCDLPAAPAAEQGKVE